MRKSILLPFLLICLELPLICQILPYNTPTEKAHPFCSSSVVLNSSWVKQREDLNTAFLKTLDADRILHNFRVTAGLPSTAEPLGGWESPKVGVRGHFVGHYLSATSSLLGKYKDPELAQKISYLIDEFYKCQSAHGNGYLSAFPEKDFDTLEAKLTGVWAPYYSYQKIMQGLLDVYIYTDNKKAYQILLGMAEYCGNRMAKLDEETIEKLLYTATANPQNEPGAMNEILYKLYKISGDQKHLELARIFDRDWLVNPLADNKDILSGLHSNTHIVLVNGFAQRYSITEETKFHDATVNFWNMLMKDHVYVNGSSSGPRPNAVTKTSITAEHWGVPGQLSNTLSKEIAETCVSHNTQKLNSYLFSWTTEPYYADAYMNLFYNAIMPVQNMATGAYVYHLPLGSPRNKKYLKEDDFFCCTGSSVEAYSQLNSGIYYHDHSNMWVNLYIPSEVNWKEKNVRISQAGEFPSSSQVTFTVAAKKKTVFSLNLFIPSWAKHIEVYVNGEKQSLPTSPVSFLTLDRTWKNKDEVKLVFDYSFYLETMPDDQNVIALFYGPTLLAFEKNEELILKGNHSQILENLSVVGENLFKLNNNGKSYTLKPLYEIKEQSYGVYATIREY